MRGKRGYRCSICFNYIYPCTKTIFFKSEIPLTFFFYIIFSLSHSKTGLSAYYFYRTFGKKENGKDYITYKTCNSILRRIFTQLGKDVENIEKFDDGGWAEIDETYLGGKNKAGERGRNNEQKTPMLTLISRDQRKVIVKVLPDSKRETVTPYIQKHIDTSVHLSADEFQIYDELKPSEGYEDLIRIKHKAKVNRYVDPKTGASTNNCEGFHSMAKSIFRTYRKMDKKYIQCYMNYAMYLYNHKDSPSIFEDMIKTIITQNERTKKEDQKERTE